MTELTGATKTLVQCDFDGTITEEDVSFVMLVSAFAGKDFIDQAYQEAIAEQYRFYSFGDCMLIL